MNGILSHVRNLQFATHLVIMQINYTAAVTLFHSILFKFVNYDIVPTEEIYSVFSFESEPYSEQAGIVGYESRYVTENTGSLLIYIVIDALRIGFFYALLKKCNKDKFKKTKKWA